MKQSIMVSQLLAAYVLGSLAIAAPSPATCDREPVAQLGPIASSAADTAEQDLQRILSLPWVRPGDGQKVQGMSKPVRLRGAGRTPADIVLGDRD